MKQLLGGIARITRIAQGGEDCPGLPGLPREARIAQDYQDCPGRQGGRNNGPSNLSLARVSPFGAQGKIGARAWLGKRDDCLV